MSQHIVLRMWNKRVSLLHMGLPGEPSSGPVAKGCPHGHTTPSHRGAHHTAPLRNSDHISIATCENTYSPGYGVNPRRERGLVSGTISVHLAGPAAARLH